MLRLLVITLFLLSATGLNAQILDYDRGKPKRYELTDTDRAYIERVKRDLQGTAQSVLGRRFQGTKDNDLDLLQALVDRKALAPDNTEQLQAMGYYLGDLLAAEMNLKWIIYEDNVGRARALAVPFKEDVIFPVTMISRRYEVGAKVDVQAIYAKLQRAVKFIEKQIHVY